MEIVHDERGVWIARDHSRSCCLDALQPPQKFNRVGSADTDQIDEGSHHVVG